MTVPSFSQTYTTGFLKSGGFECVVLVTDAGEVFVRSEGVWTAGDSAADVAPDELLEFEAIDKSSPPTTAQHQSAHDPISGTWSLADTRRADDEDDPSPPKTPDRATAASCVTWGRCFSCGRLPSSGHGEHVLPNWLQNRLKLHNETIHLLNGSTFPYRKLPVP